LAQSCEARAEATLAKDDSHHYKQMVVQLQKELADEKARVADRDDTIAQLNSTI